MKSDISLKAAVYLRAAELVEQGWCKGALAIDASGNHVHECSDAAVAWCQIGSVIRACRELNTSETKCFNAYSLDADWNDRPETTQSQVAARLREEAFR